MMNFSKWIYSLALVLCFATPIHAKKIVFLYEESYKQPQNEYVFELSAFKNCIPRKPTGNNLTYLRKTEFTSYGYQVKPLHGELKTKIDDISKNGDKNGDKTESIVDDLMIRSGYNKLDGKYGGNKGFDGIYIKGTTNNPIEILIIESKQFRYHLGVADSLIEHSGVTLNPPGVSTPLPAQMSDAWILYVADKLRNAKKTEIADMIVDNRNLIIKCVSAVDKVQGEINFLKLASY